MSFDIQELLVTPAEIVPDTHAIEEILLNQEVIIAIKDICHDLIIPDMKGEKIFYRHLMTLMARLALELKTKYKDQERPIRLPQSLERTLRRHGANDVDCILAGVALKRQRSTRRKAIIVTNDSALHATPDFRGRNIFPVQVDSFLEIFQQIQ